QLSTHSLRGPVEVTCSICLQYFTDPVILDCGHNFCHHCVFKYWKDFVRDRSCPEYQAKQAKGGGEGTCYRHPEPPTSFCKTDQALVCSACVESSEHKAHDVVPMEQAAQETKVREAFVSRTGHADAWSGENNAVQGCKDCGENNWKLTEKLMQETLSKFDELRQFLSSEEHTMVGKLRDILKEIVTRRDNHMSKLFREVSSCEILIRELEKKCCQPVSELLQVRRKWQGFPQGQSGTQTFIHPFLRRHPHHTFRTL
uniref:TRI25 n=1 Tax=Podarcis muralis TaxID=64176 RepID=A0A670HXT6_PODMU